MTFSIYKYALAMATVIGCGAMWLPAQQACCPDNRLAFASTQADPKAPVKHGRGHKPLSKATLDRLHQISTLKHGAQLKALPVATERCYDARTKGVVPPVGNQAQCGDCYLWSTSKVVASAQMNAGIVPADGKFMIAVSYLLDCHPELGGCNGGDELQATQLIQTSGAPSLVDYGGDGSTPSNCKPITSMKLYTVNSIVMCSPNTGVANTQDIKNCIKAYGYVSVAAAAGNDWDNLAGNSTITGTSTDVNHAIGLVGWDDDHDNGDGSKGAWIMQNNWDTSWGSPCSNSVNPKPTEPGGYAWVKTGADSIGTEAFACVVNNPNPSPTPTPTPTPTPSGSYPSVTLSDGSMLQIIPAGAASTLLDLNGLSKEEVSILRAAYGAIKDAKANREKR